LIIGKTMFLDIGMGVLTAIAVTKLFLMPLTWSFIAAGIVFSLLVDIDFIFHLGKQGGTRNAHKHRDLLHYPLLSIPFGIIILLPYSAAWAVLFAICFLFHFIHDSIGIGWGIQWLYPLRKNHYAFFYRYEPPHGRKPPKQTFYSWKHEDIDRLDRYYGDQKWIQNIYLKWHPYAIIEFLVFVFALIVLYYFFI